MVTNMATKLPSLVDEALWWCWFTSTSKSPSWWADERPLRSSSTLKSGLRRRRKMRVYGDIEILCRVSYRHLPSNYRIDINLEPYAEEDHPLSFVIEAKIDQNRSFNGDPGTFASSPQHVFRPSDVADVPCCKPTMSWQRRARICPWGDQPMPMTRMRFWRSRTKA